MNEPTAHATDELRAFLAEEGTDLTPEQLLALRQFVDKFDTLEDAAEALEALGQMGEAA